VLLSIEVFFQRVEPAGPETSVGLKPSVDLGERLGSEAVPASLRVATNLDESSLPQYPQVLRDARLAEPEVVDELPDRALSVPQKVEDRAACGLGYELESCHTRIYYQSVI
jgi:hypothetical protein